jgi:hypothetical protein
VLESLSELEQLYWTAWTGTMRSSRPMVFYLPLIGCWALYTLGPSGSLSGSLAGAEHASAQAAQHASARAAQHASAQAAPTLGGHPPTWRRSITPDVMGLQSVSLSLCPRAGSCIVSFKMHIRLALHIKWERCCCSYVNLILLLAISTNNLKLLNLM